MLFQPDAICGVIRHDLSYHIPEILGMVHMGQVTEFMDYHIIQDSGRCEDQSVIKRKGALGRTAAPPAFLITDRDGMVRAAG